MFPSVPSVDDGAVDLLLWQADHADAVAARAEELARRSTRMPTACHPRCQELVSQ
jgi:hypothetical protein